VELSVTGASHSRKIGFRLEGFPAGVKIDEEALRGFMERRAPGRDAFSTSRKEPDAVVFTRGVANGATDGSAVEGEIANTDFRPGDYGEERTVPRPGHADFPQWVRFGRIPTGGGSNSGRMTAALCAAGWLCLEYLAAKGVEVSAKVVSVGGAEGNSDEEILAAKSEGDSVGGVIECEISGLKPGLGGSLFAGVESALSAAMFAIPGVKGIEFGNGFAAARLRGSENNDAFSVEGGKVVTETNRHGGILGGRTSSMPIVFRIAMKPTPTIFKPQQSVDLAKMEKAACESKGRHDPCIARRAVPAVEAMAAYAIAGIVRDDEIMHPRICLVLTGRTLAEDVAMYEAERYFTDMVELRADFLSPEEREKAASFPGMVDVPAILTFRRRRDGGEFDGGEDERREFFRRTLAASPRFAYVDFESDFRDAELSAAAEKAGAKVVRSLHDFSGAPADFKAALAELRGDGETPKIAFMPKSPDDVARLFREAETFGDFPRIICAMGEKGLATRVLAGRLGSILTYASTGALASLGHFSPRALVRDWRVRTTGPATRVVEAASVEEAIRLNADFSVQEEDAVAVPPAGGIWSKAI
jgi:chorismate synthase